MQSWSWETALFSCAASSSPPPPSLSCMVQYDRQMCENAAQHPAWLGAVQQKWFLKGDITVGGVPKRGLQCCCFYHTQDFLFFIKGAGARQMVQKGVSSYSASWHMSNFHFLVWTITLPVIHLLNSPLFFLQNDDGPDVRAGSGDILLVHATETERKGTVWRHLCSLCVFLTGQCANGLWGRWNSCDTTAVFSYSKTDLSCLINLKPEPCYLISSVLVWQILFCTVKLFWQLIGLL